MKKSSNRLSLISLTIAFGILMSSCATNSAQLKPVPHTTEARNGGFSGYETEWTMDQISAFKEPLHLIGKVTKLTRASRTLSKDMYYDYVDYEISVQQSDVSSLPTPFIARQVQIGLSNVGSKTIHVGDSVVFIGSIPNPDDFGVIRGVADWMIKVDSAGTMDFGDANDHPRFNDYASKFGLKERN